VTRDAGAVERTAARVLVIDGSDRVLLLHGSDPADAAAGRWWFTPGGGLDPGESAEEAARRELAEETGLVLDRLGPAVWVRTAEFDFMGDHYRQAETFFLARVDDGADVDFSGHTLIERDAVHDYRWWSVAELGTTDETVYPSTLGAELALVLADGPPAQPKDVGP
jgi:8-oxo-dGTP pyrophosphatase MutT (NUDIX family)